MAPYPTLTASASFSTCLEEVPEDTRLWNPESAPSRNGDEQDREHHAGGGGEAREHRCGDGGLTLGPQNDDAELRRTRS